MVRRSRFLSIRPHFVPDTFSEGLVHSDFSLNTSCISRKRHFRGNFSFKWIWLLFLPEAIARENYWYCSSVVLSRNDPCGGSRNIKNVNINCEREQVHPLSLFISPQSKQNFKRQQQQQQQTGQTAAAAYRSNSSSSIQVKQQQQQQHQQKDQRSITPISTQ